MSTGATNTNNRLAPASRWSANMNYIGKCNLIVSSFGWGVHAVRFSVSRNELGRGRACFIERLIGAIGTTTGVIAPLDSASSAAAPRQKKRNVLSDVCGFRDTMTYLRLSASILGI